MSFSFKYKPEKLKSGAILYRPLIPITLEGEEKIDVFSILDSGSDMTIIPKEIAEVLNIKSVREERELSVYTSTPLCSIHSLVEFNILFGIHFLSPFIQLQNLGLSPLK